MWTAGDRGGPYLGITCHCVEQGIPCVVAHILHDLAALRIMQLGTSASVSLAANNSW